jgi:predicted amidophosphoribosyltransferase
MAIEVGRRLRLPVRPLLRAVRRTRKQGTLTDLERHANVRGAFALKARYAQSGRRVLVVDDVWTTGSTLREAARVLRAATASDVYAAVVARAVGQHDS